MEHGSFPFAFRFEISYVPNDQPKHRSIVSVFFSTSRRVSKVLHQQRKGSALPPSGTISGTIFFYIHEGRFVAGSIIGIIWRYLLLLSFDDTEKCFFHWVPKRVIDFKRVSKYLTCYCWCAHTRWWTSWKTKFKMNWGLIAVEAFWFRNPFNNIFSVGDDRKVEKLLFVKFNAWFMEFKLVDVFKWG